MKLFLCEKPSQAKDIGKVLGVLGGRYEGYFEKNGVAVTWAFGHILTDAMPDAYGEQFRQFGNIDALPCIPSQWVKEVPKDKVKQMNVIRKLLNRADEVVIATDADREGEVIAREILEYCGYRKKLTRFWTSGLDTASVKKALASMMPGSKKESLYQAGLARGRADWLVGMNLSRAYTVAYAEGFGKEHTLSIGRIQTPTLRLVVNRDLAIDHFVPQPYYTLAVVFQTASGAPFTAAWQIPEAVTDNSGLFKDKVYLDQLLKALNNARGKVVSAQTERKKQAAPLPYSLSALQKEACAKLKISAAKVLKIAQSLYETHKITSYPRTPCQYLPHSQQGEVRTVFAALAKLDPSVSPALLAADPDKDSPVWNDNQVNKHSHHAIIPTTVDNVNLSALDSNERAVYFMIRNRYIAQFYPDYEYEASVIVAEACGHSFKANGHKPLVRGWKTFLSQTVQTDEDAEDTPPLPPVNIGEELRVTECLPESKKTKPPSRFTESSLLDEMKTLSDYLKSVDDEQIKKTLRSTQGLGTEATRAAIIERLFEMKYLERVKGKILSTEKGRNLIRRIPPEVADPATTAKWEMALNGIEDGRLTLNDFMAYQTAQINNLVSKAKADAAGRPKPAAKPVSDRTAPKQRAGDACPACNKGKLVQKSLKDKPEKVFLGCSDFPGCQYFQWL